MILRDVEVEGRGGMDVRLTDGRIAEVTPALAAASREPVLDGGGGALLPGLHDHHLHLMALAARDGSVDCGPPAVTDRDSFRAAVEGAAAGIPPGSWVRGVGYDDHLVGSTDRHTLDDVAPRHPVRIQHRSGALWVLNTLALEAVGLDLGQDATGLVHGRDAWLRARWGGERPPDLADVGRRLAGVGVTGITDATVTNGPDELAVLEGAARGGHLPQRLMVMGGADLPPPCHARITRGPRKLVVAEYEDPDPDRIEAEIHSARGDGRGVAIHAASRQALVLAMAALEAAGPRPGDRIEHASVAPPELVDWLARLGVTVVTQPNFVAEHGDRYLADVEPDDQSWLYRGRAFLDAGVPLAGGTDAPFGQPDPWAAMRAAVDRRTAAGARLGRTEALSPEEALALFTGPPGDPGATARRVRPGEAADLCLLAAPWSQARRALSAELVAATIVAGEVVFCADVR